MGEAGKVYLVGAGPGDPELLTLKAARLIGEADDLVVDALVPAALYRAASGRIIYVGKRAGRPRIAQEEIGRILVELGRAGRTVVRLKGGDPGVFGRASEEIDALVAAGLRFELVPGVSSALAAPAVAGIPATARGVADRLLILSGHAAAGVKDAIPELPAYDDRTTVVVLMGLGHLEQLIAQAHARGYPRELPAVVVSQVGGPEQRVVYATLSTLCARVREAAVAAPATLLLGRVAERAVAEALALAEPRAATP